MWPEDPYEISRRLDLLRDLMDGAREMNEYLQALYSLLCRIWEHRIAECLNSVEFFQSDEAMELCKTTLQSLRAIQKMAQEAIPVAEKAEREAKQRLEARRRVAAPPPAGPLIRRAGERRPASIHSEAELARIFEALSDDEELLKATFGSVYDAYLAKTSAASESYTSSESSTASDSSAQAEPAPAVEMDKVRFSAVAPKAMRPGEYAVIDLVMYRDAFRHVVDELLSDADTPARETRAGAMRIAQGASVRVRVSSPDIEIADGEEVREWAGDYLDFNFAVELPQNYAKRQVLFQASVFINDVIASRLRFVAKCDAGAERELAVTRRDILSAFMSYASQDRDRVAAIIQGMQKARPDMDIFFDVESLRSGEDWSRAIQREIEGRDVLFLCWSRNARQSEWVEREWRYALERNGIDRIEPVPIEPPSLCPPPEELARKHFNDRMLFIINASSGGTAPEHP